MYTIAKYGIILIICIILIGCAGNVPSRPVVPQRIKEISMPNRSTLVVSFRLYLKRDLESMTNWSITDGPAIIKLRNKPLFGKRSGTYTVGLSRALQYGRSYTLRVGPDLQITFTPDIAHYFAFPNGKTKALIMSYDDGSRQDRRLVKIFNRYGIIGTFHLNSGKVDRNGYITSSECKRIFRGHEISCHTVNHPHLTYLSKSGIYNEIDRDSRSLTAIAGKKVLGLSYPFGSYDNKVLKILRDYGIRYARTVKNTGRLTAFPDDLLAWHPTCHQTGMMQLGKELLAYNNPQMALLFVWGHSWEFDKGQSNNSWKYIEDFCRMIGRKRDIWYTSALDAAKYIAAIKKVRLLDNGRMLQNPRSNLTVWIRGKGDRIIRLEPGQKIIVF